MPTDLTGAPTSLGIGTYNVDADAPSGLGFNEAMAQIDALIAARAAKPAGIAAGEVPVWNGTAWVRSSAERIINGGSALPQITSSAFSAGPPAAPTDGDIWIANFGGSARWTFQFSSSSGKWECCGGTPAYTATNTGFTNTAVAFQIPGTFATTLARAGDYLVTYTGRASNSTGVTAEAAMETAVNGGVTGPVSADNTFIAGTAVSMTQTNEVTVTAGQVVDIAYFTSSIAGSSMQWSNRTMSIMPLRVT